MTKEDNFSLCHIERLVVKNYPVLGAFSFSKSTSLSVDGENQGTLNLCMMSHEGESIRLQFQCVRNLEIKTGPYKEINIVGLFFENMSGDQWPGVRIRVSSEDCATHLSFYCSSVAVASESDVVL